MTMFALRIDDPRMEPAYRPGELVLVERHRPPGPGCDVIVHLRIGGAAECMIRRLVSMDATRVRLEQYSPPQVVDIPRARITHLYRVVTMTDLLY